MVSLLAFSLLAGLAIGLSLRSRGGRVVVPPPVTVDARFFPQPPPTFASPGLVEAEDYETAVTSVRPPAGSGSLVPLPRERAPRATTPTYLRVDTRAETVELLRDEDDEPFAPRTREATLITSAPDPRRRR